ncbi:MAG: hypothetical protein R3F62_09845 [Planctomycetota bacterium]
MHHPPTPRSKHHLGVRDEGEIGPPADQRNADGSACPVRWERVRQARRKVQSGDYSDPRLLQLALERMIESLGA